MSNIQSNYISKAKMMVNRVIEEAGGATNIPVSVDAHTPSVAVSH